MSVFTAHIHLIAMLRSISGLWSSRCGSSKPSRLPPNELCQPAISNSSHITSKREIEREREHSKRCGVNFIMKLKEDFNCIQFINRKCMHVLLNYVGKPFACVWCKILTVCVRTDLKRKRTQGRACPRKCFRLIALVWLFDPSVSKL